MLFFLDMLLESIIKPLSVFLFKLYSFSYRVPIFSTLQRMGLNTIARITTTFLMELCEALISLSMVAFHSLGSGSPSNWL